MLIAPVGNARVSAPPQGSALRVGETFQATGFSVLALADTDAVGLRFSVPPGLAIEAGIPNVGECEVAPGIVDCDFGNLLTGESRTVDLRLRAEQAGTFTTRAELVTDDDSDPSDNLGNAQGPGRRWICPAAIVIGGGGGGSARLDHARMRGAGWASGCAASRRRRAAGDRWPGRYTQVDAPLDLRIDDRRVSDALECVRGRVQRAARTRFRVAYAAAQAGGTGSTTPDDDALRAYPLYPYLQSARLEHDLGADAAIAEFLAGHGAEPYIRSLRGAWLADLGRRRQWETYLEHYDDAVDTNVTLRCYALTARAALGRHDGLEEAVAEQWLTARSLPDVCDAPFDWLRSRKRLTAELIERRVRMALEEGGPQLARYLAKSLPERTAAPLIQSGRA